MFHQKNTEDSNRKINLGTHPVIHANSIINIIPIFIVIRIDKFFVNKIIKKMATLHARLTNQYKHKYQSMFWASFYIVIEEDKRSDGFGLSFNLNFNRNLTESDIENYDVKSQLEHQSQIQKTKGSGWMFDEISSRKTGFYNTTDMHGSFFLKIQLISNATHKYWDFW